MFDLQKLINGQINISKASKLAIGTEDPTTQKALELEYNIWHEIKFLTQLETFIMLINRLKKESRFTFISYIGP